MQRRQQRGSILYIGVVTALILTVGSCVAFAHREQLLVHYHAETYVSTATPSPETRKWLVERAMFSVPVLVRKLESPSERVCQRAGELLNEMLCQYKDPTDPQDVHGSLSLSSMLHEGYPSFSPPGRAQAVGLSIEVLRQHLSGWSPNVPTALATAGQTLLVALVDPNTMVQRAILSQLPTIWPLDGGDSVVHSLVATWKWRCYQRAVDLMTSPLAEIRSLAAQSVRGSASHDGDIRLIALLDDPDTSVRRSALQSILGAAVDSLTSENRARLVDLLDDPDPQIRDLSRRVLLASGLTAEHLHLAVLLRSEDPHERKQIANLVLSANGIDAIRWLHELVKDESPIVRRSAIETAATLPDASFIEVFRHLSKDDPDAEVREACETALDQRLAEDDK